ncbi:MAG TPA: DinB family protein [Planctomycetota bacterium]|nr:DinB family protein [Planctomycetota bacterium]
MPTLSPVFERLLRQARELNELATLPDAELLRVNERVSKWSVALQLEHIGIVNTRVLDVVIPGALKDLPEHRAGRTHPAAYVMLWFNWIPRGRKAPDVVAPKSVPLTEVRALLQKYSASLSGVEQQLIEIERCRGCFKHPILGPFTAAQWLRFTEVHTHHHMKLVNEIRRA